MAAVQLRTKDGRLVGTLKGNTLYKTVRKSNHLFRNVGERGAWGIDYEVLMEKMPERSSVYITEMDDGILYMVKTATWKEYGTIMHFKKDTKDHYTQVFLPIEYFNRTKAAL